VGTGFHQELTGRENIFLNGAILGMTKKEISSKIDEIIVFSGCKRYIDTPVKRYSSGMFVRLAFAVAAHLEPDILIVDEVLAVGDAEFQKKAIGKMQSISNQGGRTVLFVSHNMTSIKALCKRVVLLENGKLIKDGLPDEVIDYYLKGSTKINYKKTWSLDKRPSNNEFLINSVWISNNKKEKITSLNVDYSFLVNIDFKVIKNNTKVGLNVILHDSNQNIISSSINNHEKNYYSQKHNIGLYTSHCKIPGKLFNAGIYFISIYMFGANFINAKMIEYVLKIELEDGVIVRGDYFGNYEGVLRPMLEWETKLIQ
jgi:lipopolysaccharide transport system ATP-binding protein